MNQRALGIIFIIAAIIIASVAYVAKVRADAAIAIVANETGSCYLPDGTCLHSTSNTFSLIGYVLAGALLLLGCYLAIFDKSHKKLEAHKEEIAKSVEEVRKKTEEVEKRTEKDSFDVFLSAFTHQEQLLLKAIKEQDGILQSTLRYRVGMSKAALSQKLTEFEKKGIISRKEEGKTNKVFLRKRF